MQGAGDYPRRLAAGTAINGVGAVVGQALELLMVAIAVDRIGASAFGVLVLAQGWAMLPYLLESGIGQYVVRSVAGSDDDVPDREIVSTAVALYVALGLLTLVLGVAASFLLLDRVFDLAGQTRDDAITAFNLVMAAGAVRLAAGFYPRILVGAARLPALRLAGLLRSAVALGATAVLVGRGRGEVVDAGAALLAADVVAAVCGVALVLARQRAFSLRSVTGRAVGVLVRASGPMTAASGIALFSSRLDPVIVAVALGSVATGVYGVVLKVYDAFRSATELLSLVLMPATARALSREEAPQVATLYRRALTYIAVVVWPLAAAVAVFARPALEAWVGELGGGVRPLVAAMVLSIVIGPSAAAFYVITGAGRVGAVLKAQGLAAAVNFVLGVALVRSVGVAAVFIGSTVGAVILVRAYVAVVAGLANVTPWKLASALVHPVVAVAALTAALAVVRATSSGLGSIVLTAGVFVLYGAAAIAWLVPRQDLRRVIPARR